MPSLSNKIAESLRDAIAMAKSGKKFKTTTMVRCDKCGRIGCAKEIRGGWCGECNGKDA